MIHLQYAILWVIAIPALSFSTFFLAIFVSLGSDQTIGESLLCYDGYIGGKLFAKLRDCIVYCRSKCMQMFQLNIICMKGMSDVMEINYGKGNEW